MLAAYQQLVLLMGMSDEEGISLLSSLIELADGDGPVLFDLAFHLLHLLINIFWLKASR